MNALTRPAMPSSTAASSAPGEPSRILLHPWKVGGALLLFGALCAVAGCGSSASASPPPCSGSTPAALTVKNYLDWCAVSIEGAAASSAAAQTVCVADGSVSLSATALAGFELGPAPWHHTLGDTGSGDPGTVTGTGQSAMSSTTVDVTGSSACVWVCCPFTGGTGCPTTDQCAAPQPPPYMP